MNTIAILAPLLVCFSTTLGAVILLKPLAQRIGLVDVPGGRRQHARTTPLIGGIAMFLGMLAAFVLMPISLQPYRGLLLGGGILVFVGVLDDFHEVSARARLIAQLLALGIMVFWSNIQLDNLGNLFGYGDIHTGRWAPLVTLFGAATLINAVNFMDGLDGLAGGCILISLSALLILAAQSGHTHDALVLAVITSSIFAFLCFNLRVPGRKHAVIFMGDAGSMLLGLILAWFTISLSQGPNPAASPAAMLWIAGIPLINMATVFILRASRGDSPLKPSEEHVHHWLKKLGVRANIAVLIILVVSLGMAIFVYYAAQYGLQEKVLFYSFIGLFVVYIIAQKFFNGDLPSHCSE